MKHRFIALLLVLLLTVSVPALAARNAVNSLSDLENRRSTSPSIPEDEPEETPAEVPAANPEGIYDPDVMIAAYNAFAGADGALSFFEQYDTEAWYYSADMNTAIIFNETYDSQREVDFCYFNDPSTGAEAPLQAFLQAVTALTGDQSFAGWASVDRGEYDTHDFWGFTATYMRDDESLMIFVHPPY